MRLGLLRRRHAECDVETWQRYDALFRGGPAFRAIVPKLLPRHEVEPAQVYKQRCDAAVYLNYCRPIGSYFAGLLFSSPPVLRAEPEAAGDAYVDFKESADGDGTDLDTFFEERFVEALVKRRSYWRVELPQRPAVGVLARMSRKDYEDAGFHTPRLVSVDAEQVIFWRTDAQGRYLWLVEHQRREELLEWTDAELTITETWTYWSDAEVKRWALSYVKSQPPGDETLVPEAEPPVHFGRLPFVKLELPETLWLMSCLADPALEHFRKSCGLSWAIDRSCYAMPYFFLKDARRPPVQGPGYYGLLGHEDRVEYPAPSNVPYDVLERRVGALKDEIHRVAVQMSRGIDNNAAAVGRSGESKEADDSATEVVLGAYARPVREAYERTMELVSFALDDDVEWSVEGMDAWDVADAGAVIANALTAQALEIPSQTYHTEVKTRAALVQMRDAPEDVKQKVRQEIEQNTTAESILPSAALSTGDDEATPAS